MKRKITERQARMLDIFLLAPLILAAGIWLKRLPKLVRYGLISIGLGLIAWNAFDLIDHDEGNSTVK